MTTLIYGGSSPFDPPFPVIRSVRLRSAASAYFSRTPASAGNRTTWTWSGWVKRGKTDSGNTQYTLFSNDSANNDTGYTTIYFYQDFLRVTGFNTSWRQTSQVFRDIAGWYHIVIAWDTTQATANNRIRIYVNGAEVTAFSTLNNPALNATGGINAATATFIGADVYLGPVSFFDGYITEVNFIDGQALTPASFGSYNSYTGVWQPARYTGTYGTNGFYLNFRKNSASTSTQIGADSSGNGNNWTPNNIVTVSASTTYDSMVDVPGMPTGNASNYPTLNAIAAGNAGGTYSNANLNFISGVASQWRGAVATQYRTSGKFYFEATIQVLDTYNYLMIGACGIQTNATIFGNYTGLAANGWSVQSAGASGGNKYNNGSSTAVSNASFTQFVLNDVLQCAVDVTNGRIWFGKNNVWLEGDPAAGTGASYTTLTGPIAPSISCFSSTAQLAANFGQRPFTYTPPTGFSAVNTYNAATPTIPKGNAHFDILLWTGAGTTGAGSITGLQFQPGFVWTKTRSAANSNLLYNANVGGGTNTGLSSNTTDSESSLNDNATNGYLTTFDSGGFSYFGGSVPAYFSSNTQTYVGWNWKAATSSVSNTSGSITSTVRANPSAGFSIVTYTGTGANATVGHGLGIAPKMVIAKTRSVGTYDWCVYHANLTSASYYIPLNGSTAQSLSTNVWNATAPTSAVFSVGTSVATNQSSQTLVAFCFAEIPGFSAFGVYTGNGVVTGPFIYTGFRARYVLIKRTDTTGSDWWIYDTARNPYNSTSLRLTTNSTAVDAGTNGIDITSNGFRQTQTDISVNASGGTYIYAAFAENPLQYALAR